MGVHRNLNLEGDRGGGGPQWMATTTGRQGGGGAVGHRFGGRRWAVEVGGDDKTKRILGDGGYGGESNNDSR